MTRSVRFRHAAHLEFKQAARFYETRRRGLGTGFMLEIRELVRQAAANPARYPIERGDTRKAVAHRFPYSVYFRSRGESIVVIAVFHSSRNPLDWQNRI